MAWTIGPTSDDRRYIEKALGGYLSKAARDIMANTVYPLGGIVSDCNVRHGRLINECRERASHSGDI